MKCDFKKIMRVFLCLVVCLPLVFGQEMAGCYSGGSVAGAAIGAFLAALLLVAAAYYLRKLYWKTRKGMQQPFFIAPAWSRLC